jgi:hypothetical protein
MLQERLSLAGLSAHDLVTFVHDQVTFVCPDPEQQGVQTGEGERQESAALTHARQKPAKDVCPPC